MNTKVVPNPEQKGWEEDGTTPNGTPIYKWESGGGSGGSSLWEQNGSDISYNDGNVSTTGTFSASGAVTTADGITVTSKNASHSRFSSTDAGGSYIGFDDPNTTGSWWHQGLGSNGNQLKFKTANQVRLTINNNGNSTFSGDVSAAKINASSTIRQTTVGYGQMEFNGTNTSSEMQIISTNHTGLRFINHTGEIMFQQGTDAGNKVFKIQADGNATFSGTIGTGQRVTNSSNAAGVTIYDTGSVYVGRASSGQEALWRGRAGDATTSQIRANGNAEFSGTVSSTRMTQGGSPVIDAKGLINTLSTLRNATKDETTLKGMRDALADAIGGLIENLEHEIATMPAPEPEVSTMEIEA